MPNWHKWLLCGDLTGGQVWPLFCLLSPSIPSLMVSSSISFVLLPDASRFDVFTTSENAQISFRADFVFDGTNGDKRRTPDYPTVLSLTQVSKVLFLTLSLSHEGKGLSRNGFDESNPYVRRAQGRARLLNESNLYLAPHPNPLPPGERGFSASN